MNKYANSLIALLLIMSTTVLADTQEEQTMQNVLDNVPYQENGMGKRKLVDEKYLLMMQAALSPGQSVPQHSANSNVHLVVLEGEVVVNLDGVDTVAREGTLLPVAYKTPMNVKNISKENATFLIIKTPNPSEMK